MNNNSSKKYTHLSKEINAKRTEVRSNTNKENSGEKMLVLAKGQLKKLPSKDSSKKNTSVTNEKSYLNEQKTLENKDNIINERKHFFEQNISNQNKTSTQNKKSKEEIQPLYNRQPYQPKQPEKQNDSKNKPQTRDNKPIEKNQAKTNQIENKYSRKSSIQSQPKHTEVSQKQTNCQPSQKDVISSSIQPESANKSQTHHNIVEKQLDKSQDSYQLIQATHVPLVPGKSFYDYSLKLPSFASLNSEPFSVHLGEQCSLSNPPIVYGVVGNSNSGKTHLISELQARYSIAYTRYDHASIDSNSIYLKSVSCDTLIALFMKAPSFNSPLSNNNNMNYNSQLNERELRKLFAIGFFAYFSNILIIVVDGDSDKDYQRYYHQIANMRKSNDNIFIVHNLDRLLPPNQEEEQQITKQSIQPKETEKKELLSKNTIHKDYQHSKSYQPSKNKGPLPSSGKQQTSNKDTPPSRSKEEERRPPPDNKLKEQKQKKLEELLKILNNESEYEKNNFITMNSNEKKGTLDYYYKEKLNHNIIHLLYQPLSTEEYDNTYNSNNRTKSEDTINKQYNTQVINFLASAGACYIQTQKANERVFVDFFIEYTSHFIKHIYNEANPQLTSLKNEIRLTSPCSLRPITRDLIQMNYNGKDKAFIPKYSYRIEEDHLVIYIETLIDAKISATGKIIGENNVLYFTLTYNSDYSSLSSSSNNQSTLNHWTLPNDTQPFEIRIHSSYCVINNFKSAPKFKDGIVQFKFKIFKETEGEEEVISF